MIREGNLSLFQAPRETREGEGEGTKMSMEQARETSIRHLKANSLYFDFRHSSLMECCCTGIGTVEEMTSSVLTIELGNMLKKCLVCFMPFDPS